MLKRPRRFPQFSHWAECARAMFTGVAMVLVTAANMGAFAQSKPADLERKIDDVSQKLELLDRSSAARFEAMDKIRAAETKALEDRIDLKKDLTEVRKDVVTNAQQTVNWWLAGLAIFLTIFGIAVPIIFTRELRSKVHAHLLEIEQARREIASIKDQAKANSAEIEGLVGKMRSGPILGASPDRTSSREAASISKAAEAVAESKEAELADRLFAKGVQSFQATNFSAAAAHFASVVAERPDDHVALFNWGVALGRLADAVEGAERERLRREEISKYEAALKLKPDKHEALSNWGVALGQLADAAEGAERERLRREAISKFEAALKIKPDMHDALSNWGVALSRLADAAEGTERERLRTEEVSKYEAALKIKPDMHDALSNWGVALGRLADAAEGAERERLRREAISKCEAALKIKPDMHEALSNLGAALLQLAHETTGQARSDLLARAELVLQQHAAAVGHLTYNLACVAAMHADVAKFVEIADALPLGALPDAAHLRSDRDLDGIRNSEAFLVWWQRRFGDLPNDQALQPSSEPMLMQEHTPKGQ